MERNCPIGSDSISSKNRRNSKTNNRRFNRRRLTNTVAGPRDLKKKRCPSARPNKKTTVFETYLSFCVVRHVRKN